MKTKIVSVVSLIGIAVAGRLLPHLPNATPLTAVAARARTHLGTGWAVAIPLIALVVSDVAIGFYDWRILVSVYLSFAAIGLTSHLVSVRSVFMTKLAFAASASFLFFLITNLAVWFFSPWYPKTLSGLLYCYTLGLPFLRTMFLGDTCFLSLVHVFERYSIQTLPAVLKIKTYARV